MRLVRTPFGADARTDRCALKARSEFKARRAALPHAGRRTVDAIVASIELRPFAPGDWEFPRTTSGMVRVRPCDGYYVAYQVSANIGGGSEFTGQLRWCGTFTGVGPHIRFDLED